MEKRYFVLKKGYLNINQDFFYFSDHGNWRTCEILEETESPKLTFFYVSKQLIKVIYTIILTAFIMGFIFGEVNLSVGVLVIGAIVHFFDRRYKIKHFKIPVHKIERIYIVSNTLEITFVNSKNEQIIHTVRLDDRDETKDIKRYLTQHFNQKISIA